MVDCIHSAKRALYPISYFRQCDVGLGKQINNESDFMDVERSVFFIYHFNIGSYIKRGTQRAEKYANPCLLIVRKQWIKASREGEV